MLTMAFGLILLVALGATLVVQWTALALGADPLGAGAATVLFLAAAVFNAAMLPVSRRSVRAPGLRRLLSRTWIMTSVALLLTGLLLAAVFVLVGGGGTLLAGPDATRPALVWAGGAMIALGFGAIAWGASVGNHRVRVDSLALPLRHAGAALETLRIAHVTDLHIGPLLPAERLRRFVDRINALEPDLVMMTGDLFDFDPAYVEAGCRELGRLHARRGVFAVLGNHDVYTGSETVAEGFARHTEVQLLRDSWVELDVDGTPLAIAGIEDPGDGWTERDSENPALERLAAEIPRQLPCLLLSHRPAYFLHAARLGFSLVLAGHTHGGQVALPLAHNHNLSRMIADRTRGVWQAGGSTLYVNRGLGMAGLPLRLNCPREIALIRLVAAT